MQKLMTANEVASKLSISRSMVYKLMKEGEIQTVRIGARAIRVTVQALQNYVERSSSPEFSVDGKYFKSNS